MNQFIAFTKKEFYESVATFRLYILFAVFLVLGMLSPLMAKLTPEILEMLGDMGTGIAIQMPEPTMMDAWGQFFKNLSQIGMLALVIVFGGLMSNELSKGSLTNLLTKGLNRHTVIFSKFFSASVLWICSYLLCFGVCYAYTAYFWEIGTMGHALLAFAAPWLFGEFMLALLIFSGTLFGNIYGSLLSCLGAVVVLSIISIVPQTAAYNPLTLSGGTLALLSGLGKPQDFIPATIVCTALIILLIAGTTAVFDKKVVK